ENEAFARSQRAFGGVIHIGRGTLPIAVLDAAPDPVSAAAVKDLTGQIHFPAHAIVRTGAVEAARTRRGCSQIRRKLAADKGAEPFAHLPMELSTERIPLKVDRNGAKDRSGGQSCRRPFTMLVFRRQGERTIKTVITLNTSRCQPADSGLVVAIPPAQA